MTVPDFLDEEQLDDMGFAMTIDVGQWKNTPTSPCKLCKGAIDFPCYCSECKAFMCTDCYSTHLLDFIPAIDVVKHSDGRLRTIDLR